MVKVVRHGERGQAAFRSQLGKERGARVPTEDVEVRTLKLM
jgi:hypothetical protein